MSDIEKFKRIGLSAYNAEQIEKRRILEFFLSNFNDGRKKTRFSVAVNLLDIDALQSVIRELESDRDFNDMGLKEKSALVAKYLQDIAEKKNITLKLRKK